MRDRQPIFYFLRGGIACSLLRSLAPSLSSLPVVGAGVAEPLLLGAIAGGKSHFA